MGQAAMIDQLKTWGIHSKKDYILQAFSRNIGLLTPEEQERLSHARVAIPGMGGVGGGASHHPCPHRHRKIPYC